MGLNTFAMASPIKATPIPMNQSHVAPNIIIAIYVLVQSMTKGWLNTMIKRSCENPNKIYVTFFRKRYIFENGKYVGWYYA
jgi:hypothetical protein